ncbi:BolA/IbaG family iron-sulfur metabolism protein [Wolbachia endosymbiont of Drosophila mauritiana]|uniref:BolA/IbaG family iron-sulfur metabolism protein n=1 Tax=unclassified Wolbachia TaxID=2640676 RepID=UPI00107EA7C2|nr:MULTISPECIES: BolA/IbaG family iron-sulfur metabolism protein [unclassified Wolbachia]QCB62391.1 BolA/IbaG family iron-sulfur metabolism protein [Wolbachia endosymbiont of Drosophila mauritiana]QCB63438.1 BolA/IbaG family iron-sulfur metabolism protein [Wolbachia endosymbiont of Drosophila mauritiana]QWE33299.1 BolA-like protein [Wolbachia endosymbiont of Drosophila simulans]TGB06725.1 BolA/IbaG family iron-sulfur metabolism protein [Wolbachia endosymbiont of Drosophila mauritiana]
MTITIHELGKIIKQSFPDADIKIKDLAGDDDHYHLKITSKCFSGKTKIEQHRMVYKALEGQSIHALQLETGA